MSHPTSLTFCRLAFFPKALRFFILFAGFGLALPFSPAPQVTHTHDAVRPQTVQRHVAAAKRLSAPLPFAGRAKPLTATGRADLAPIQSSPVVTPTFTASFFGSANSTESVAVGDLNGDGLLDIVEGNGGDSSTGQQSVLYFNNEDGSWTAVPFGAVYRTMGIAVGDLNGDGWLDIVQGNRGQQSLVYYNDGAGNFHAVPFGITNTTTSIAVGDLNGDGWLDIVQGNSGQQSVVYYNDGAGNFTSFPFGGGNSTSSVALGDLNGDGWLDMVQGNSGQQSAVYYNDGAGGFAAVSFGGADNTSSIALGDLNGDGLLDIVQGNGASNGLQQSVVFYNNGAGGFAAVPFGVANHTFSVALGDLNGDGLLDIVQGIFQGIFGQPGLVYYNQGNGTFIASPLSAANDTNNVALADVNGDGWLDIVQGNGRSSRGQQSVVYFNQASGNFSSVLFGDPNSTTSVAVGDLNGDGLLDIVQGNGGLTSAQQSLVYYNQGNNSFAAEPFGAPSFTFGVVLADLNGDGRLDIVQGNGGAVSAQQSVVYYNQGNGSFTAVPFGAVDRTTGVAVGDLNGDGWLDIVQGNGGFTEGQQSFVFYNDGNGGFSAVALGITNTTTSVAVGDVNGDGLLDIVQGNADQQSVVYYNDGAGNFNAVPFGGPNSTNSVTVGDLNGDGLLDIVQGNIFSEPGVVYYSDGAGGLTAVSFGTETNTNSVIVGDLNGDGRLDIIQANDGQSQLFYNQGNETFATVPFGGTITARSVAVGDLNGDGRLDIVQGTGVIALPQQSLVYLNPLRRSAGLPDNTATVVPTRPGRTPNAGFFAVPDILSGTIPISYTLADPEGDPLTIHATYSQDGGGHWLPALAASGTLTTALTPSQYFSAGYGAAPLAIPDGGALTSTVELTATSALTATDVNVWVTISHTQAADVRLVLQAPSGITITLMPAGTLSGTLTQTVQFDDAASGSILSATAPYGGAYQPASPLASLNGLDASGNWKLRVDDVAAGETGSVLSWGIRVQDSAGVYVYNWDTLKSGFFGESDDVVFRLQAFPTLLAGTAGVTGTYRYANSAPLNQYAYASAATFPFRVRGTQIRVMNGSAPVLNAIAYRLPYTETLGALPISDSAGQPFRTDAHGYLQGSGLLNLGDQLVAVAPISSTSTFTVSTPVTATGFATLYDTSAAPTASGLNMTSVAALGVQTLTVSAAHPLTLFDLAVSLEWDARQDTQFLNQLQFDLQRASEILFQVTNGQAALGNVTVYSAKQNWDSANVRVYADDRLRPFSSQGGITTQPITDPVKSTMAYFPGQLTMAATWNRYGNPGVVLGEDWPRTLAHELGHYLFYQDDDYVGLNAASQVIQVTTCTNTIMADPYRDDYTAFHTVANWSMDCGSTLANQETGRADWQTVTTFYPALIAPSTVYTGPSSLPLAVTQVSFVDPLTPTTALPDPRFYLNDGYASYQPGRSARAFLFKGSGGLVDLGSPVIDQVLARGAEPGDQLCVFEPDAQKQGCKGVVVNDNQQLSLSATTNWQPDLIITPVTSQTVSVSVGNEPAGLTLKAQLYASDGTVSSILPLNLVGGAYTGTFNMPAPVLGGYVRIWVDSDPAGNQRGTVTAFALGGNPTNQRGGFTNQRGGFTNQRGGFAPVMSADGQMVLYTTNITFPVGTFYAIQAATYLPNAPGWASVVGKGYRLLASAGAPSLSEASLSLSFATNDVPVGGEPWLQVYFYDGASWQALASQVNSDDNSVVAQAQGPGLYALMTALQIPLYGPGWNLISYPVQATQTVTQALLSIAGHYTTVYGYVVTDTVNPWRMYDVNAPAWVNDLSVLQFGQGYWITVTQDIVLQLNGAPVVTATQTDLPRASSGNAQSSPANVPTPPATYYGVVLAANGFTPTAGLPVTAWINGLACGEGTTLAVGGRVMYLIHVSAAGPGAAGCGVAGASVTFSVGTQSIATTAAWGNDRPEQLDLAANAQLFLPWISR